ncbi:MAG: hypothetical protein ACLPV8_06625 [Steroidobacteraceae bacterium]
MHATRTAAASMFVALMLGSANAPAQNTDACADFKWDVSKERGLFAGPAAPLASGANSKSAPVIVPNRLYGLQLMPQAKVRFAAAPGKRAPAGAYAGLARLKIPESGSYRVAIDAQIWIDVASDRSLLAAQDFQGQHGCSAPHKIVVFDLPAKQSLILQLSSAAMDRIRLTITPTPARSL